MAGGLMAQPVYPQLRKCPCIRALTLRAMKRGVEPQHMVILVRLTERPANGDCYCESAVSRDGFVGFTAC